MEMATQLEQYTRQHRTQGVQVAYRILRSWDDAEDAYQEAVVAALTTKFPWRGDSAFSTWFHRVILNKALIKTRDGKRTGHDNSKQLVPLTDEIVTHTETPEKLAMQEEAKRALLQEVASMKFEHEREALFLRFFEGLQVKEMAVRLRVPLSCAKTRTARGLGRLRHSVRERLS